MNDEWQCKESRLFLTLDNTQTKENTAQILYFIVALFVLFLQSMWFF